MRHSLITESRLDATSATPSHLDYNMLVDDRVGTTVVRFARRFGFRSVTESSDRNSPKEKSKKSGHRIIALE
jgi:hypothetical protein